MLPLSRVAGKEVTTLEGLPARWAKQKGLPAAEAEQTLHPVQQAWIDEQVPQCGFCQNGMMIKATELLEADAGADGRADQDRVHERSVAASVPLRQLLGDHRCRAARGHARWRRRGKPWRPSTRPHRRARRDAHPPPVRQDRRRADRRLQPGRQQASVEQTAEAAAGKNSLDAALSSSWFEIHADNTILMRTGKVDFGQTTAHTAYKQIVAEELNVPFEAITAVVMGDTDRTPDGGFSAGFLEYGGANLRKAAAYTYQALLDLAATHARRGQEPAVGEGRRRLGRRQEHLVRRARAGAAAEADDSGRPATSPACSG